MRRKRNKPGENRPDQSEMSELYRINFATLWKSYKQEGPAFWWLCLFFLFEYLRPQSLYPAIDIIPWGLFWLSLVIISTLSNKDSHWVHSKVNILLFLFSITVLISIITAYNPSASIDKVKIFVTWIIVYFAFVSTINTEKRFFLFILFFLVINFKMSQFGTRQFLFYGYSKFGVSGSPGWFKDAGDLGHQMLIFVCFSTAFVIALKEHWGKWKLYILTLLPITGAITIIATASRGVQLGLACTMLWFLLKSKGGIKAILILSIIAALLYAMLPEQMLNEFKSSGTDNTSQQRLILWNIGWGVIKENPIFGIGYYNWLDYCNNLYPHGIPNTSRNHCLVIHNTYITAAVELGFAGLILYILLILSIFRLNSSTRKNTRLQNRFLYYTSHGSDGGLVGYLVASAFFDELFSPIFWVHLAISVSLNQISLRYNSSPSQPKKRTPKRPDTRKQEISIKTS